LGLKTKFTFHVVRGIALVKGKVLYIVMPWELRAEPEIQGVNAPIAVSSPA
jgi:hypothetical protein